MKCKTLFETIDSLNQEYLQFLTEICTIESPTEYKEGVDRVGAYFAEKAREKGWLVETQHQEISGDVVAITMNPEAKLAPVCFSGHMDTVHPIGSFGETPVHCDEENIYGPGVTDCKGGIAAAFMAMDALERCGFKDRPIKLLLQSDEENGSRNSAKTTVKYMAEKAEGCVALLNTEPGRDHGFYITTKGICKFRFHVVGRSSHSCRCHLGASAISEAAQKILQLEKYKNPDDILCNCGLIQGGSAENTVPEECTFTADFRFHNEEERERIMKITEEIAGKSFLEGTSCSYVLASSRCAMIRCERNIEVFNKVKKIHLENGLGDMEMIDSIGATDAADLTQMGIPCLEGFGVLGGNIHKTSEFARLDSLAFAAKRMASVAFCI